MPSERRELSPRPFEPMRSAIRHGQHRWCALAGLFTMCNVQNSCRNTKARNIKDLQDLLAISCKVFLLYFPSVPRPVTLPPSRLTLIDASRYLQSEYASRDVTQGGVRPCACRPAWLSRAQALARDRSRTPPDFRAPSAIPWRIRQAGRLRHRRRPRAPSRPRSSRRRCSRCARPGPARCRHRAPAR
jgi:hypothetical protein